MRNTQTREYERKGKLLLQSAEAKTKGQKKQRRYLKEEAFDYGLLTGDRNEEGIKGGTDRLENMRGKEI